jgi:D-alanyl-D-alanine carboxypeptidase (penicillin-binding protein 5/6)
MKVTVRTVKIIFAVLLAASTLLSLRVAVGAADAPTVNSSKAAMLYCLESGTTLYTKNETERYSPGILTKLMVAVVAAEEVMNRGLTYDSTVIASALAIRSTRGPHIAMKTGEQFRIRDLIAAMIHTGADDAAYVIAEGIADTFDNFIELMNLKAEELGMTDTHYYSLTATEDEKSYTTAADQVKLACHAMKIQLLSDTASEIRAVIPATNKSEARYYGTTNYLLTTRVNGDYLLNSSTGFICGTNGNAGYCGVLTSRKDGLNYIAVVLGAENVRVMVNPETTGTDENGNEVIIPAEYKTIYLGLAEARELLIFGENAFSYIKAVSTATPITDLPVRLGSGSDRVAVLPEFDLEVFVPDSIDKEKEITYTYTLEYKTLTAPVKAGQRVGTLYVSYKGQLLGEVPLVTRTNIEQNGYLVLLQKFKELMMTPFFIVMIALTAFAAVFYVLSTAITRQKRINDKKRELEKTGHYLSDGEK